jgi:hypothetical protein
MTNYMYFHKPLDESNSEVKPCEPVSVLSGIGIEAVRP